MLNIEEYADGKQLFDGHYKLLRPLSTDGGTADVWLAVDVNTIDDPLFEDEKQRQEAEESGMLVAIKIYRPKNALDIEGEQRFRDEYKIVYECRHENLLQPTSFSVFQKTPYLVLPYCKFGSSELLIGQLTDEDEMWKFVLDVASGLERLHTNTPQIVHQDIKPANILIDNTHRYAITDFGISSKMGGAHSYYYDDENSGTLAYMAPERFQEGTQPMPESDIWAFGATLFEILTGQAPFGESGGQAQTSQKTPLPPMPGVPADIQRLVHACLNTDTQKRPTAKKIIEAAKARQFPLKSKTWLWALLAVLAVALVAAAVFLLSKPQTPEPAPAAPQPTAAQRFDVALARMNSRQADTLKLGLAQMDSLSRQNYIPAIYEMAFTYGWYSDSVSVRRKQLLGIQIDESCLPTSDKYSNKAVAMFTKIMELNDSAYPDINAKAIYRLACYYVMPNKIYKPNYDKGKRFLLKSREWAALAKDDELLETINKGLATFE